MIIIDGSKGEGGGQVLRSSLSMSMLTGRAFTLKNIRGCRPKPGLRKQHLSCVLAAAEICHAQVSGAELNSTELVFHPGQIRSGSYLFDIQSAGSAGLVLQTILPALLHKNEESEITLRGGTHNPLSPNGDFLKESFIPILKEAGFSIELTCRKEGFFPCGGGEYFVQINKRENSLQKIHLDDRLSEQKLSFEILHTESDRQAAKKVKETLINSGILQAQITSTKSSAEGRGLVILARVQEKDHTMILSEFGIKRFDPSEVAKRILKQVESYLDSGYFVDEHLADQLMIPMLFCGGHYRSGALSLHSRTNIKTIEAFLGKVFEVEGREVKCPGIAEL